MAEGFITAMRYSISISCALAIVENLLVLAVFAATKRLRIKYYAFILNLVLSDLLFAAVGTAIPWTSSSILEGYSAAAYTVSILTIFSASINRYLALSIVPPARYDSLVTGRRVVAVCFLLWLFGLAYGLLIYLVSPPEVFTAIHVFGYPMMICIIWVLTALAYFLAFRKIKQYTPPLASTPGISANTERDHTRVQQTRRLLILFVLILVTSFLSWLPTGVLLLNLYFNRQLLHDMTYRAMLWVAAWLYALSTAVNPVMYWWRLDAFKEGLHAMCCRCVVKAEPRETEVMTTNDNTMVDTGL